MRSKTQNHFFWAGNLPKVNTCTTQKLNLAPKGKLLALTLAEGDPLYPQGHSRGKAEVTAFVEVAG